MPCDWPQGGLPLGSQGAIGKARSDSAGRGRLASVRTTSLGWTALPLLLAWPATALPRADRGRRRADAAEPPRPPPADERSISAPTGRPTTAKPTSSPPSGRVRMDRDGNYLAADRVDLEPRHRRGRAPRAMSWSSIPKATSWSATGSTLTDTLRDGTIDNLLVVLESGGRIAAAARDPQRRRDDARQCGLFALPGDHRDRLPAQPELEDHRRPGHPGSGDRAGSASRAAGSACSASPLPLLPIFSIGAGGDGGRQSGALVPDIAYSSSQRARAGAALLLAARPQPRPDAHPAHLLQDAAGDRRPLPPADQRSAPTRSAASSPTARSTIPIPTRSDPADRARHPRLFRGQWQVPVRPLLEPDRRRSGSPPTRPSPAATTSPATTCCAISSRPSGSAPTATSRSPAGRSRACASTTTRSQIPIALPAIDARLPARRPVARRQGRAAGQQPRHPAPRRPGHAARLRQRALGPAHG